MPDNLTEEESKGTDECRCPYCELFLPELSARRSEISSLRTQLAEAEHQLAEQRWIPVSERLPELGTVVLWGRFDREIPEYDVDYIGRVELGVYAQHPEDYYTHWRPLPAPPKGEQGNG